jgi:AcrR family transcriptional regulator
MVHKDAPRPRGRPRAFDTDAALDAAILVFWDLGYDAASVDALTTAMGLSKPSLYAAFGDKTALFLAALARYGQQIGARAMRAFQAEPDIGRAVTAFLDVSLTENTRATCPPGCLIGSVAPACADSVPGVAALIGDVMASTRLLIARRFAAETAAGALPQGFPAAMRAALLVDLMQAQALRARLREPRDAIAADIPARSALIVQASQG